MYSTHNFVCISFTFRKENGKLKYSFVQIHRLCIWLPSFAFITYGIILNLILVLWKSELETVNCAPSEKHSLRGTLPGLRWLTKGGGAQQSCSRGVSPASGSWGTGHDSLGLQERGWDGEKLHLEGGCLCSWTICNFETLWFPLFIFQNILGETSQPSDDYRFRIFIGKSWWCPSVDVMPYRTLSSWGRQVVSF